MQTSFLQCVQNIEFVHYHSYNPGKTDSIWYVALLLQAGSEAPKFIPLFEEKVLENRIQEYQNKTVFY